MMAKLHRQFGVVFLILAASPLFIHGGEDTKADNKTESLSKKIIGHWEGKMTIDEEALKKMAKDNGIPETSLTAIKKQVEASRLYFSFQEDGTGKGAGLRDGQIKFDEMKWKLEKENGNQGLIALTEKEGPVGKLQATLRKDGTIVATIIPPEKTRITFPDLKLTLTRLEKLPEETQPKDPEKPETEKETSKPE
ncbi:MAG: hypothetical protein KDA84_20240 [Planctomycetaceae bacterium]|nr:hypothetical protein [Planctomycetaceae bacterium]